MDFKELTNYRNASKGFTGYLGMRLTKIEDGYAEGEIEINENHLNILDSVHGGCIFSLIDTVGGSAAMSKGNFITTSSCNITFLSPAINTKKIKAVAKEVKNGKTLMVYDIELFDDNEKLIAKATGTFFRLHEHDFF